MTTDIQTIPTIRCVSLWQPWATLMATLVDKEKNHAAKMIETRHWSTAYRGWLAIHAAKHCERGACEDDPIRGVLWDAGYKENAHKSLPSGCIVSVGYLDRCVSTNSFQPVGDEYEFGDYSQNRFGWVFSKMYPLDERIPMRGQQGLWTLDEETAALVFERALVPRRRSQ